MRSETYLNCCFFEMENSVVGYALLNKTYSREAGGPVVWVEELYIKPLYQGKGIGGSFFHWLEANVPAKKVPFGNLSLTIIEQWLYIKEKVINLCRMSRW